MEITAPRGARDCSTCLSTADWPARASQSNADLATVDPVGRMLTPGLLVEFLPLREVYSAAAAIKIRETEIAKLDVLPRTPRALPPNIDKLCEALTLRAAEWKSQLRAEPEIARLVFRRLIGPLVLPNPTQISPQWIQWEGC